MYFDGAGEDVYLLLVKINLIVLFNSSILFEILADFIDKKMHVLSTRLTLRVC